MPPDDVVIIVDAHDVLFFPCKRDIVEVRPRQDCDLQVCFRTKCSSAIHRAGQPEHHVLLQCAKEYLFASS